jgi:predicted RNA-binding Zn ribbon-like protein
MAKERFELLGGVPCLDFVNTIHEYGAVDPREELHGFEDLVAFAYQSGIITRRQATEVSNNAASDSATASKTLTSAREFRLAVYHLFSAIANKKRLPARDLEYLNRQLGRTFPNLQIRNKGDDLDWEWKEDSNLERVLWPILRSAAELLTSVERRLIRECGSETCTWLFLDRSKNRTRLWCDMKTCGNRAKWRRYYKKHKKSGS